MAIAADDRHPGQGCSLLRADYVDDALVAVAKREIRLRPETAHVGVERFDLQARGRVGNAVLPVPGRRVVIGGRDDRVRAPDVAARELQAVEGLRARDFVHEMPVDVEERRAVVLDVHGVARPELVVKSLRRHGWRSRKILKYIGTISLSDAVRPGSGALPALSRGLRPRGRAILSRPSGQLGTAASPSARRPRDP